MQATFYTVIDNVVSQFRTSVKSIIFTVFITLFLIFFSTMPSNAKYASLVVDANTGVELYSRNANTKNFPASLTKIMTLYMIFDALERRKWALKTRLKVSRRASRQPQTRLGLKGGSTITVRTAILALITRSANDVATVVAENMSGTERRFAKQMTLKAKSIGMANTTFRNASGLPNRGQVSTARDMVKLAISIRSDFPKFYRFFKTRKFRYRGRTFKNHNMLLGRYSGTDGIKTGYTNASGYNLVASVRRQGRHLIGVVFGGRTGPRRDRHMVNLLDKGFIKLDMWAKAAPPIPKANPLTKLASVGNKIISLEGSSDASNWGIQVGAYSKPQGAQLMIKLVHSHLKLDGGNIFNRVEKVKRSHGVIFRARLIGMREQQARRACATLATKHLPCVPVPADIELAQVPIIR